MPGLCSRLRLGWLALVVLAACAAPAPVVEGFRDTSAPFASTQRFETERFLGEWVQVAAFAPSGTAVTATRHLYRRSTTGQIVADVTAPDGAAERRVYALDGPGRLRAVAPEGEALWVLWVDEGFRTAVLGTPSGSTAFILDRNAAPAPDRLRAAREILDWYGYDMGQLQTVR